MHARAGPGPYRRLAVIAAALACAGADGPGALDTDAAACGACHEAAYASWAGSRHAVAATNAVFTASWESWPNGWCLGCHAPRPEQQLARLGTPAVPGALHALPSTPPGAPWAEGVGCAACHVRDGVVRSARAPSDLAIGMHPIAEDPSLATEALCATCHEFAFQRHSPPGPFAYGSTPAQATVSEWRGSAAAARGERCQDCHMGEHGHGFPGAHTPELVRGLVRVEVTAVAGGVRAVVRAPGAAHRVPTGDPFRRLVLELCATPACDVVVGKATLRRVFRPDAESWTEIDDRTVGPERPDAPAERVLAIPADGAATWWRMHYRYGDARFEAALPADEVGYVVAEGPVLEGPW